MNELNKDQVERIEELLNRNHVRLVEAIESDDQERYKKEIGKSIGMDKILDIIGYDSVWNAETEGLVLRRKP